MPHSEKFTGRVDSDKQDAQEVVGVSLAEIIGPWLVADSASPVASPLFFCLILFCLLSDSFDR